MKKINITNNCNFHYEIIESIIVKYNFILKIENEETNEIYLSIFNNVSYIDYIKNKYPNIILIKPNNITEEETKAYYYEVIDKKIDYDYVIDCTIYIEDLNNVQYNSNKYFYILHEFPDYILPNNIYGLTPLCNSTNYIDADILPFIGNKINSNVPVYIIQGGICYNRRNYELLDKIINNTYTVDFIIKIIGFKDCRYEYDIDTTKYEKNKNIIIKTNLNYIDYHREFLDGYCIIPLISKKTHEHYYKNKLTSSINYGKAYGLKFLIDKDLQEIYNINNAEIYENESDIVKSFKLTIDEFYTKILHPK